MITTKVKAMFFDRAAVKDLLDKKTRKALSKAGAFIRTRAKSSIRTRKKVSQPGTPPSSHTGKLKHMIWFALEPSHHTVVIGPVGFNQKSVQGGQVVSGTVPSVLEFGGQVGIREKQLSTGVWVSRRRRSLYPGQRSRVRVANYRPRPYMGPALEKERAVLPQFWAQSVKGA